jgi:hypothetical protein
MRLRPRRQADGFGRAAEDVRHRPSLETGVRVDLRPVMDLVLDHHHEEPPAGERSRRVEHLDLAREPRVRRVLDPRDEARRGLLEPRQPRPGIARIALSGVVVSQPSPRYALAKKSREAPMCPTMSPMLQPTSPRIAGGRHAVASAGSAAMSRSVRRRMPSKNRRYDATSVIMIASLAVTAARARAARRALDPSASFSAVGTDRGYRYQSNPGTRVTPLRSSVNRRLADALDGDVTRGPA